MKNLLIWKLRLVSDWPIKIFKFWNLSKTKRKFEKFKERLEHFAKNHRAEIQKNPEFRRQFQSMCASIGVDPLASSRGFWADMLGVGDYYYELAVRVVEYCLANRNKLGGLIQMSVIAKYLGENPNDITIALKVSKTPTTKFKKLFLEITEIGIGLSSFRKGIRSGCSSNAWRVH